MLLVAQTVGLQLTASTDLPADEAQQLLERLRVAITAHTGLPVVVDDPLWDGGARALTDEVVVVEVIGGLTLVRVVATRGVRPAIEADVARDEPDADVRRLAARLFPEGRVAPVVDVTATATVATGPAETSVAPWLVLGASAVVMGVGIAFGASSRSARADSQDPMLTMEEFDRLADRTQSHAVVADVSFAAAAIGALVGGVLWATE